MSEKFEESEEFKLKLKENIWEDQLGDTVTELQKLFQGPHWSWVRNMSCKYVEIKIDMRDGGFILKDQHGKRISLDSVKWQYSRNSND